MNISAFIPARSGSKRIPNKNIKELNGQPLIYWTIKAALKSKYINNVYLTTESDEIADTAIRCAINIESDCLYEGRFNIIKRPEYLSTDIVQSNEVFLNCLRQIESAKHLQSPDTLVLLQPTSPFRKSCHINEAFEQYREFSYLHNTLFSATKIVGFMWDWFYDPINHNPSKRLGGQWTSEEENTNYLENGAIYIIDAKQFSLHGIYRMKPFGIYEMPRELSIDLDTPEDWKKAEQLARLLEE